MKRFALRLVLFVGLVIALAAPNAMADGAYTIQADSTNQSAGYTSFELTSFRPGRHLVDIVRTGNDRSRRIITTLFSTAIWFEIVTATDAADVWLEYLSPTNIVVEVNGEFIMELWENEFGEFVVTDSDRLTPGSWKSLQTLAIFLADVNVQNEFVELQPYDDLISIIIMAQSGAACHAANCAGPCITNEYECQNCCEEHCIENGAQLNGCFHVCDEVWNGTGVSAVVLGFLAASGCAGCVLRRRIRAGTGGMSNSL